MKPSELDRYIKKHNLEPKYNGSFNRNRINSPKTSFYSVEKINKFVKTGKKITPANYYNFLSNEFRNEGYENFREYLKNKVKYWKSLEKSIPIDEKDGVLYLIKKFVTDPIQGKIKELKVKENLINEFKGFQVLEPTPEEDLNECWDFKITNSKLTFFIQNKPESFFRGLKTTTKHSFEKIRKASIDKKIPIFFTKYNEQENCCEVAIIEKNSYKFKKLSAISLENEKKLAKQSQDVMLKFKEISNPAKSRNRI